MKKYLLTSLLLILPFMASAETIEINGIWFNIVTKDKTAEVTYNPSRSPDYSGDITIPEQIKYNSIDYPVTKIGDAAFAYCTNLTSVIIPSSVFSIGMWAFYDCSGLTSIDIPNNVTSIGSSAFSGCSSSLFSINVDSNNPQYDSRNSCNAIIETSSNTLILGCKNTTIPGNVTSIGSNAFRSCYDLVSITIPKSVLSINGNAFEECSSLTSINVDSDNPQYDSRNSCNAIIETSSNTLITGCMNTTIPNSVTSIGRRAFYGCHNLTFIIIPNSVTSIEVSAFENCSGLTSITIPNSMTSIGNSVFYSSGLTSITIPNSVSSIEECAFQYCWALRDFYCWAENVPTIYDSTFEGTFYIATIHVPAISVEAYKQTYPWNKFLNIVPLTDDDPKPTDILSLKTNDNIYPVDMYSIDGKRKSQYQRGLNIIRMSDGTTKKFIVK